MAHPKNEFTNVTSLRAEALGQPGKRTFRILVNSGLSSAIIWLEKDELFQLAMAIHQLLATLPKEADAPGTPPGTREAAPAVHLDFKASKLALGHDGGRGLFVLDAHDPQDEDQEIPNARVWAKREQIKEFADEAIRACAAGRPLCPLCGRPIDPTGHPCPRVNGHVQPSDL